MMLLLPSQLKIKLGLKSSLKQLANKFGFEVMKKSREHVYHVYASLDQQALLTHSNVEIIFDLGASVGNTAQEYHQLFPQATIYAFEPSNNSFTSLVNNCHHCNLIKPYQLAIADSSGYQQFFLNQASMTNSLLPTAVDSDKYVDSQLIKNIGTQEVNTITLDEFCQQEKISTINLLKMDLQGGEVKALQGAINLLSNQSIDLIYTEVNFVSLYENQAYFWDVGSLLQQYNYRLFGLYNFYYSQAGVTMWGDAIFISSQLEQALQLQQK